MNKKELRTELSKQIFGDQANYPYSIDMDAIMKIIKQYVKENDESWRRCLKNPEWMKIFLKKHHPELLGVK